MATHIDNYEFLSYNKALTYRRGETPANLHEAEEEESEDQCHVQVRGRLLPKALQQ